MSRLVRLTEENPEEDVLILGGEHGVVTLHMPGGHPDCMVLHSPVPLDGFEGPHECLRMETACWSLSSISGVDLDGVLIMIPVTGNEDSLWGLMERCYRLYLAGSRR